jgi:hypothetical protein
MFFSCNKFVAKKKKQKKKNYHLPFVSGTTRAPSLRVAQQEK